MSVVVVSGGTIFLVDPSAQTTVELPGMVMSVIQIPDRKALLFDEMLRLSLLTSDGVQWRTKRLSWDGMRNLSIAGDVIRGEGWRYDETWHEFIVALETGISKGGAYDGPDP